jgi:hypothetical protein
MAFATVYRVKYTESERGWGQDTWHTDFPSYAEAMYHVNHCNETLTDSKVPDVYIRADYVGPISVEVPDNVEEEKKMAKETVAQRRAREAQEANARAEKWEAEKPMRLLYALARAHDLDVKANVYFKADNILYYEFNFGNWENYSDPVVELGEATMDLINQELGSITIKRAKERRLRQVKEELLARLTDEEREALGL